jgi:hypothetical protein
VGKFNQKRSPTNQTFYTTFRGVIFVESGSLSKSLQGWLKPNACPGNRKNVLEGTPSNDCLKNKLENIYNG